MVPALVACLLGATQGMRHAFEPDHIAAVSTMVAEQKRARASIVFASVWGLGHSLVLLALGGALFALRKEMPPRLAQALEALVAVMLLVLGARGVWLALRHRARAAHGAAHATGGNAAQHTHTHAPVAAHAASPWSRGALARPLSIGIVHGLAGSGAVAATVAAQAETVWLGLVFVGLYAAGATAGMAALAGLAGVPLARLARRKHGVVTLLAASGLTSVAMGFVWGYPILQQALAR